MKRRNVEAVGNEYFERALEAAVQLLSPLSPEDRQLACAAIVRRLLNVPVGLKLVQSSATKRRSDGATKGRVSRGDAEGAEVISRNQFSAALGFLAEAQNP